MPKGVLHHLHFDSAHDADWFIENLAYLPTSYYHQEKKVFKYFKSAEVAEPGYKQLCVLREQSADKK